MMTKPIILIGGGGHCLSCIEAIESSGRWGIVGIVDDKARIGDDVSGYKIIGSDEDLPLLARRFGNALIAVGQLRSAAVRIRLFSAAIEASLCLPVVSSGTAIISRNAKIGRGTIVMHHTLVNAGAVVGENCIINSGAIIEHEAAVGDNTHISTGAIVNGDCRVGCGCLVGSNAVLKNGVIIGDDVVIGAGATVVCNLLEPGVYVGCPARKMK